MVGISEPSIYQAGAEPCCYHPFLAGLYTYTDARISQ
jgi:hypothetical protein